MTGATHTAAQSLLAILALPPSPHLREKPCSSCSSKARPQHSQTKPPPPSPASCIATPGPPAWPGRKRKQPCTWPGEAQALGGPGPGHPGKARPLSPPAALLFGKWGLHLVVLYLVYGDLRVPSIAPGEVKAGSALPSWPRGFSRPCPPGGGRRVVGMRRDRRTREGQRLLKLRRQGSGLCGLGQWVPLPSGSGGVW